MPYPLGRPKIHNNAIDGKLDIPVVIHSDKNEVKPGLENQGVIDHRYGMFYDRVLYDCFLQCSWSNISRESERHLKLLAILTRKTLRHRPQILVSDGFICWKPRLIDVYYDIHSLSVICVGLAYFYRPTTPMLCYSALGAVLLLHRHMDSGIYEIKAFVMYSYLKVAKGRLEGYGLMGCMVTHRTAIDPVPSQTFLAYLSLCK